MPYATIDEFKAMSKLSTQNKDDVILLCIESASLSIDAFCNRKDGFTATPPLARTFASAGRDYVSCDDCIAVTQVEEFSGAWVTLASDAWVAFSGDCDQPDYQPPYSAVMRVDGTFPTGKLARVRITAQWGAAESAPAQVKAACLAQATKWFKRFEGSWATSTANNTLGRKAFVQALDQDIEFMLVNARLVRPAV